MTSPDPSPAVLAALRERPLNELRAAVIGLGTMGRGIVHILTDQGVRVQVHDPQMPEPEWFEQVGLDPDHHHPTAAEAVADADLIFEVVYEDLAVKEAVLREISAASTGIIASNTSTFQPGTLAEFVTDPSRLIVIHFFNAPQIVPLVEIVPHPGTHAEVTDASVVVMERLGKKVVLLGEQITGFVANRLQAAILRECFALVEAGIASPEQIDEVVISALAPRWSVVGPLGVADLGGLDIFQAVCTQIFPSLNNASTPPAVLTDKVARGELGAKTGTGFYEHSAASTQSSREQIAALLARARL